MYDELQDLKSQAADIQQQRRELEADAFNVMLERPTFFAFKLLLGIKHSVPEPLEDEPEPHQWAEQPAQPNT
jgi:hypothetical protein